MVEVVGGQPFFLLSCWCSEEGFCSLKFFNGFFWFHFLPEFGSRIRSLAQWHITEPNTTSCPQSSTSCHPCVCVCFFVVGRGWMKEVGPLGACTLPCCSLLFSRFSLLNVQDVALNAPKWLDGWKSTLWRRSVYTPPSPGLEAKIWTLWEFTVFEME